MKKLKETFILENFSTELDFIDSSQAPREYRFLTEAYKKTWIEIEELLTNFKMTLNTGQPSIEVTIDWSSATQRALHEEWSKPVAIQLTMSSYKDNLEKDCIGFYDYAELLLYNIFFIANLSAPGCFDLYHSKLVNSEVSNIFRLSADRMEASWIYSIQKGFPGIARIPLKTTYLWYKQLDIGIRQIAKTRLERAIFALIHFCNSGEICPSRLIWITHALEALYDTPSSLITQILKERIYLVLGEPQLNSKKIKQEIGGIYDLRSRFVHGDFNIVHPMVNDIFDEEVLIIDSEVLDSYRLSLAIVIATIQKLIVNGWKELNFSESFDGKKVSKSNNRSEEIAVD